MSEHTKIQWAVHTFNPWEGCTKISPGCAHCYADARAQRFAQVKWGKGQPRRRTSAANWKLPVRWNKEESHAMVGHAEFVSATRPRVFCASLADWLDEEVPIEWLADLLRLIHETPNLDWLLLTKRPGNWKSRMAEAEAYMAAQSPGFGSVRFVGEWLKEGRAPHNIWVGVSVEDQTRADERIPQLLTIPARVRFLSCEPLLGPLRIKDALRCAVPIHWCIIGGESGHAARECGVEWIRGVVEQCRRAGVAPFVKQLGRNPEWTQAEIEQRFHERFSDAKGGDPAEWPEDLRVREFPSSR